MSEDHDGGPAFPQPNWIPPTGMTLRDWFAGQALNGLLGYVSRDDFENGEWKHKAAGVYAQAAYRAADAMLKERAK